MLIYTTYTSSRFEYIIKTLFAAAGVNNYKQVSNKNDFIQYDECKINYSEERISGNEIWIKPKDLLFDTNIEKQNIDFFEWHSLKCFFKTDGDMPFDIFSASFYLITRYEEYLPHEKDIYGRYAHTNSLSFKEGFLHLPIINLWLKELMIMLQTKWPSMVFHQPHFSFTPTYDIDIAYSYRYHSLLNKSGGILKSFIKGQWETLQERLYVLTGKQKDPFDTYNWLDELHEKHKLKPIYFFLIAERRKGYDRNLSPHRAAMQKLIKGHSAKYKIGIHPSWQSEGDINILKMEIKLFEEITDARVSHSRQHYIRMHFPDTYRLLIDFDIKNDYSMGYGSINGFRASFTSSFYWFDLKRNEQTDLQIHPFCYMEANSFFEQQYSAEMAAAEIHEYFKIVRSVNGHLITIFHNHFITEQPEWIAWRNMYETFLNRNFQ